MRGNFSMLASLSCGIWWKFHKLKQFDYIIIRAGLKEMMLGWPLRNCWVKSPEQKIYKFWITGLKVDIILNGTLTPISFDWERGEILFHGEKKQHVMHLRLFFPNSNKLKSIGGITLLPGEATGVWSSVPPMVASVLPPVRPPRPTWRGIICVFMDLWEIYCFTLMSISFSLLL